MTAGDKNICWQSILMKWSNKMAMYLLAYMNTCKRVSF